MLGAGTQALPYCLLLPDEACIGCRASRHQRSNKVPYQELLNLRSIYVCNAGFLAGEGKDAIMQQQSHYGVVTPTSSQARFAGTEYPSLRGWGQTWGMDPASGACQELKSCLGY